MPDSPFDPEAYLAQAERMLGIVVLPEHRPGVIENLRAAHAVAQAFLSFPLPDDVEAGPIFRP
jgi:hypothetical protein